jgi:DNA-binding IclR family transcriptional regulator
VDGSWLEIDGEILDSLRDGPKSPRDLSRELGLSAAGVTSLLLMLAAEGKVRVTRVELTEQAEVCRPLAV